MAYRLAFECDGVDWADVADILRMVGMGAHGPALREKAFRNSSATVFVYENSCLVGFGRAVSDNAYQAAVYDVALRPEHQGRGLGRLIMENIMTLVAGCTVILYANPGKEGFYQKFNFRRMNTGLGVFLDPDRMKAKGIID